MKMNKFF